MSVADDLEIVKRQESGLVFQTFNETDAIALGDAVRDRAVAEGLPIIIDIRLWDRPLYYAALPGSSADNLEWARRKTNVVRRFATSSYRMLLANGGKRETAPDRGLDSADYALHGGGFPIAVRGVGVIGAITVSGLPERRDHTLVVEAICAHLGLGKEVFALADL